MAQNPWLYRVLAGFGLGFSSGRGVNSSDERSVVNEFSRRNEFAGGVDQSYKWNW